MNVTSEQIRQASQEVAKLDFAFGALDPEEQDQLISVAIETVFAAQRKHQDMAETFKGTVDKDTTLEAIAREAGWALMELLTEIDWKKRNHVSRIITDLGMALNASEYDLPHQLAEIKAMLDEAINELQRFACPPEICACNQRVCGAKAFTIVAIYREKFATPIDEKAASE